MKKLLLLSILFSAQTFAQVDDEIMLKNIYNSALTNSKCYDWLDDLSNKIGSRLSGSVGAEKAVEYTQKQLQQLGLDRVFCKKLWCQKDRKSTRLNSSHVSQSRMPSSA